MLIDYDRNLESYKEFYDIYWAREIDDLAKNTKIGKLVFKLCATWKGASNARRLPYMVVEIAKSSISGVFRRKLPPTDIELLLRLRNLIAQDMEYKKLPFTKEQRSALLLTMFSLEPRLTKHHLDQSYPETFKNELWESLAGHHEFFISLWMSEANAYCAVFFAYENFIVNSLKTILGIPKLRTRHVYDELSKLTDSKLAEHCWKNEERKLANLIRDAFVHNGHEITPQLESYKSQLRLAGNQIIIMPEQTTRLFHFLKTCAFSFVKAAVSLPDIREEAAAAVE